MRHVPIGFIFTCAVLIAVGVYLRNNYPPLRGVALVEWIIFCTLIGLVGGTVDQWRDRL